MANYLREIKISMEKKKGDFEVFTITTPEESAEFFRKQFGDTIDVYESFMVLYLNNSNETIGWQKISSGGINQCVVDIRILMGTALKALSTQMIVCHNHPSGSLRPSEADKKITKQINEACKILEIRLLDHLIVTENSYFSFANEGLI